MLLYENEEVTFPHGLTFIFTSSLIGVILLKNNFKKGVWKKINVGGVTTQLIERRGSNLLHSIFMNNTLFVRCWSIISSGEVLQI